MLRYLDNTFCINSSLLSVIDLKKLDVVFSESINFWSFPQLDNKIANTKMYI